MILVRAPSRLDKFARAKCECIVDVRLSFYPNCQYYLSIIYCHNFENIFENIFEKVFEKVFEKARAIR